MCGFVGFLTKNNSCNYDVLQSQINSIHHRGPDDCGIWSDKALGVGLAHARLAIKTYQRLGISQ